MVEAVELGWTEGGLERPSERYGLLERGRRLEPSTAARVLAFGIRRGRVRLLLEGESEAVTRWLRGLRSATTRDLRRRRPTLSSTALVRRPVRGSALTDAVASVHRWAGAGTPLGTPWSSHRDLLGFRNADFYDAGRLVGRIRPEAVHTLAGGQPMPSGRAGPERRPTLAELLRVCGGVRGVLPADRRCFRLFAHTGRRVGHRQVDLAGALALTPRRMRQLEREREPRVPLALRSLGDPRLRIVP